MQAIVDGIPRTLGLRQPSLASLQYLRSLPRADERIEIIPERQWGEFETVADLEPSRWWNGNQGNVGACAGFAVTGAYCLRAFQQFGVQITLNAYVAYRQVTSRDVGSDIGEIMRAYQEVGGCSDIDWPQASHRWSELPSDLATLAATYQIDEAIVISSWEEFGSCLAHGLPVVYGHNFFGGGHAELALRVPVNGKVKTGNSWGEYGPNGDGVHEVPVSSVKQGLGIYTAVCVRSVKLTMAPAAAGMGQ